VAASVCGKLGEESAANWHVRRVSSVLFAHKTGATVMSRQIIIFKNNTIFVI